MKKILGMAFILIGAAVVAMAFQPPEGPEINPASAGSALALLTGTALVIRGRRRN
jgi:uncharacterized membrane protein HdeD (DUF308 family)